LLISLLKFSAQNLDQIFNKIAINTFRLQQRIIMTVQLNNVFSDYIDFNSKHKLNQRLQSAHYQIGFICCIQALAEDLGLEQWLPHLSIDDAEISFTNEEEAVAYGQKLMKLVEHVQSFYQDGIALTTLDSMLTLNAKGGATDETVEFCNGFLNAIELFNDHWLVIEQHQATQELFQTTVLLLTKLTEPENTNQQIKDLFEQLPEANEIINIVPQLLSHLAYTIKQNSITKES